MKAFFALEGFDGNYWGYIKDSYAIEHQDQVSTVRSGTLMKKGSNSLMILVNLQSTL